ncbi:nuclear transport factor 2 family protein [Halomarina salina]|uniref:Nuclear transport factor 2 family protein n=1 Tax=Halomarina salina TaxID=1872699 RepID=A0ABD5RNC5_9EURY|nr:nuclear transport factor 2 family protein [Halomarina salina]
MASTPRAVVEELFERMADEQRRGTIRELFAPTAVITLPAARFEGPDAADEMLDWFSSRYEWADKEFDRWVVSGKDVVCLGTLYGVDSKGERFDGVRFVDVYEVTDGRVERMVVHNDLVVDGVVE